MIKKENKSLVATNPRRPQYGKMTTISFSIALSALSLMLFVIGLSFTATDPIRTRIRHTIKSAIESLRQSLFTRPRCVSSRQLIEAVRLMGYHR